MRIRFASLRYRTDVSNAAKAKVYFRDDGSAERLEADRGFLLVTGDGRAAGGADGDAYFDEHNQPLARPPAGRRDD